MNGANLTQNLINEERVRELIDASGPSWSDLIFEM